MSASPRGRGHAADAAADIRAQRLRIEGRVQAVGFRPFVYRLARAHDIAGWVCNEGGTVTIHAEGAPGALARFRAQLETAAPPFAQPRLADAEAVAVEGLRAFAIVASRDPAAHAPIHVPPDQFACADCLAELRDPGARRYRYPFINCTQCGPRYTIIRGMPYDRGRTTMAGFPLCTDCRREYEDPEDRRFHAEPLACPRCGPRLRWRASAGDAAGNEAALGACRRAIMDGCIVAVRGIGGYHLICDAADEDAVQRLRARKNRPDKPLAVLLPERGDDGLDAARELADLDSDAAHRLADPVRPIVLVPRRAGAALAPGIAPGVGDVGLMLAYSPLHHLLLDDIGRPLVATSGNVSGEPVVTTEADAEDRLAAVADAFVHHDRPIERPADDPVYRSIGGHTRPLRLGRGNAPLERRLPLEPGTATLAVGAFLKNTVALGWGHRGVVSPHLGDLESPRARALFRRGVADLQRLYGVDAARVVCDAHPDFPNTRWARDSGLPLIRVLHHEAHASALAGEIEAPAPLLVFTWDGVGYGAGGALWGGEALLGGPGRWRRVASLLPIRLPGGERAVRQPWRTALAMAWAAGLEWTPSAGPPDPLLRRAWERGLNAPDTSAVGRLFDGAAALAGVVQRASYEGEGPARLEAVAGDAAPEPLPLAWDDAGIGRIDWRPLVPVMADARRPLGERAGVFHASLARALAEQARRIAPPGRVARVGLTGGVFQNRLLCAAATRELAAAGYETVMPAQVPVNDAGISYGQLVEVAARDAHAGDATTDSRPEDARWSK